MKKTSLKNTFMGPAWTPALATYKCAGSKGQATTSVGKCAIWNLYTSMPNCISYSIQAIGGPAGY